METLQNKTGWQGFLSFTFARSGERTVVKDKKHFGPLVVQRPYYQEIDLPMVLVLHPPGGVVGGDELEIEVKFEVGAKGMVSTPAATKFYRSKGILATQTQTLTLASGSELEWLPQESLFFDRSKVKNQLTFDLGTGHNKLIAWDVIGLGRPESGENYQEGELSQTLEVILNQKRIFIDRVQLTSQSSQVNSQAGFAGHTLFATALFYCTDQAALKELLSKLQAESWRSIVGVTQLDHLIVLRALSSSLDEIKQDLYESWALARPLVLGRAAIKPRIWNT